jgi:RTX calcium-binding nonapeptide repeat (4 copies)
MPSKLSMTLRTAPGLQLIVFLIAVGTPSMATTQDPSCSYDPSTHRVTATMPPSIHIVDGRIHAGPLPCGDATPFNTDEVHATEVAQSIFILDFLAPGFTSEPEGQSEIEIFIQISFPSNYIVVEGSPVADRMILGTSGLNMNGDDDRDIAAPGANWTLSLGGGRDTFTANGASGTESAFAGFVQAAGESGADRMTLGRSEGELSGDIGPDLLIGGSQIRQADQILRGGGGRDVLRAGPGADYLSGGPGYDKLLGGPGRDFCAEKKGFLRSCELPERLG